MPLIKCPSCGRMISSNAVQCPKCRYVNIGQSSNYGGGENNGVYNQPYSQSPSAVPNQTLSFLANYYMNDTTSQGGKLYIEDEFVVFKPHAINIGDKSDKYIPIKDVRGYNRGFFTILYILLNNGIRIKLAVWKKKEIIDAIEERRYAIYRRKGQEPPRLTSI